jgi:hypothetical protein
VAIFIRNELYYEIISQFIDTEGRIILLNINIKDTLFTLVCLYAPNWFIFHLQPIYVEGAKINYIVGHCHITK